MGVGRKLKDDESPAVRKDAVPTAGDTALVVADNDDDDVDGAPHIVEERRSSQATADFESSF